METIEVQKFPLMGSNMQYDTVSTFNLHIRFLIAVGLIFSGNGVEKSLMSCDIR